MTKPKLIKSNSNAWAYELESVPAGETIVVDDPASIKHHRALNTILTEHNGIAPENLQELINEWQTKKLKKIKNL